jgi:hypothetical protein
MEQRAKDREVVRQARRCNLTEKSQHVASVVEGVSDEPAGDHPNRMQTVL